MLDRRVGRTVSAAQSLLSITVSTGGGQWKSAAHDSGGTFEDSDLQERRFGHFTRSKTDQLQFWLRAEEIGNGQLKKEATGNNCGFMAKYRYG